MGFVFGRAWAAFANWDPVPNPTQPNVTLVHHNHIRQLRTKLEEALNALHLPIGTYEHSGPNANDPIYAIDFQELRNKIKGAWTALANSGISQFYDGDGLRVKKTESGATTWYLRSSVLGGQVVAEINGNAVWQRGYVYAGSSLLAVQQGGVFWTHEDPVTKSKRVTDSSGNVVSTVELDPWGGDTNRSSNAAFQPKRFTSYERDGNQSDEAMFRRYNRWWSRFDQPDPYDGSYSLTDPQSFNRYSYVQNDPVNFIDPSGLSGELAQGIGTARTALEGSLCRGFLGGANAVKMFNTYVSNNLISVGSKYPVLIGGQLQYKSFGSADTGAVTTYATGSYMGVTRPVSANRLTINQNGFYFSGRIASGQLVTSVRHGGFEGLNMSQVRGAVILHEFAHALGRRIASDDPTVLKDNGRQSRWNAQLTRLMCFSSLNEANRPASTTMPPLLNTPLLRPTMGSGGVYLSGGMPGWWYSMWAFVDWVNSIPVGRGSGRLTSIKDDEGNEY